MASATPTAEQVRQAADTLEAEVVRAYRMGGIKVKLNPERLVSYMALSPVVGAFIGEAIYQNLVKSTSMNSLEANFAKLGMKIERWRTVQRQWAEAGQRSGVTFNGDPATGKYTWAGWSNYGKDLLSEVKTHSGLVWEASPYAAAIQGAIQTLQDVVVCVLDPVSCIKDKILPVVPWWVWGVVGVSGAVFVYKTFAPVQSRVDRTIQQGAEKYLVKGSAAKRLVDSRF